MAHGQDPETLNDVTGIFDSWDASKKYHHRVKGRGTEHFALPTLIEAQCKLFNVLHKGMDVDGSAFYAAAGGIGGGQPPVVFTEGMGTRKKVRARDSKHLPATGGGHRRPVEDMSPLESQVFAVFFKFYSQASNKRFPVTFLIQKKPQMDPESQNLP